MALSKSPVLSMYDSVIEDVLTGTRNMFIDEGLDEQILEKLKMIWISKLINSNAVEATEENIRSFTDTDESNDASNSSYFETPKTEFESSMEEDDLVDIQITLPIKQDSEMEKMTRIISIKVPADALENLQNLLSASMITAAMELPDSMAATLLQNHVNMTLKKQLQENIAGNICAQGGSNDMPICDGGIDTSDDEITMVPHNILVLEEDKYLQVGQSTSIEYKKIGHHVDNNISNIAGTLDGNDDTTTEDSDISDEKDNYWSDDSDLVIDSTNEDDPLNSNDDISDGDPSDLFDTDNVIVCQYDKILRSKNKWKLYLKDGIMNLDGKDFIFQKAFGDAEW